ncbi:MAG: hypothetical protein M3P29_13715 [Acidobacteriota bacterium]|nr:hypothetical protein [Acidobacteriota bacterium]
MKPLAIALLSFTLAAVSDAATVALGVGAASPNEVVVKIDGRDAHLRLDGAKPSGDPAAATFLRCLVSGRVVRVQKTSSGTAKVTMLDGSVVAELLNEFLDTRTKIDPCALGKAAYQPQYARVAGTTAASEAKSGEVAPKRETHLSFASSGGKDQAPIRMPAEVKFPERKNPPPPPPAEEVPTIAAPGTTSSYRPGQARIDAPPTASTTTIGTGAPTAPPMTAPSTPPTAAPYTPPVTQQKPPAR